MISTKQLLFIVACLAIDPAGATTIPPKLPASKVHYKLTELARAMSQVGITRQNAPFRKASSFSNPLVRMDDSGFVETYIDLVSNSRSDIEELAKLGVIIDLENPGLRTIQARVPFDQLATLEKLSFVRKVRPPVYAKTREGSVLSEGTAILNADQLQAYGYTGSGIKVGVISDGANSLTGPVASGDLPSGIVRFGTCSIGTCNEGTAMMEIIHDLAPSASLGFGAVNTSLDFIARVNSLRNTFGASIIVDDLGFPGEPYFEDGDVATAVASAVSGGIFYTSACGNDADQHYLDSFNGTTTLGLGLPGPVRQEHNFGLASGGASDPTMNVIVGSGGTIQVFLQWNDAFGTSSNDYDLILLNNAQDAVLASSTSPQDGTNSDPFEALIYTNQTGSSQIVKVVVEKFSGSDRVIQFFLYGNIAVQEYNVAASSIVGHPAVPGVIAAGTINADDPGNNTIAYYSSLGPTQIYFPSFVSRPKPDITGIDGVSVTGSGGFGSPFYGTSASAPHIAGLAALLKGTSMTASQVSSAITTTAIDLGTVGTDNTFGAGRADVLAAAQSMNVAPNSVMTSPLYDTCVPQGGSFSFQGTCDDPNGLGNGTFLWSFGTGSGILDSTAQNPGSKTFSNTGNYEVTFTCTDAFGLADGTPATRIISTEDPCLLPPTPTPTPSPPPTATPTSSPTPVVTATSSPTPDPTATPTPAETAADGGCAGNDLLWAYFTIGAMIWTGRIRKRIS